MESRYQFAYYALWIGHPVLQSVVAVLMLRRKLHRKFPVFFAYLLSQILNFAVVFSVYMRGAYQVFFYAYWAFAAINLILGFLVIHEVFVDVFRPYHTLKDLGTVLFKWAGLVMLLVAGVVAAGSAPSSDGPLVQAILTVERCVRVIQCGLILFLVVFSRYLGVTWKQRSYGIALGFGGFAAVELLAVAITTGRSGHHPNSGLVVMATYNLAIFVWLAYMSIKREVPESSAAQLATQRWEQGLHDLQHPTSDDSLIPMFEDMVDRALSRTQDEDSTGRQDPTPGAKKLTSLPAGTLPVGLPAFVAYTKKI
jgi:hypothetical protein